MMGSDRGDNYIRRANSFASFVGLIGALVMSGLMLLTVADVVLRYVFNAPILGSYELTEMAMVVMAFLAIPYAAAKRVNVRVDLVVGALPKRILARFDAVTCCLSLIITAILGWYTIPQGFYIKGVGVQTEMLKIHIYPLYFVIAFGFFLLFFVLIGNLIEIMRKAVDR
jgi:TRAP-type C4-dicarboxylate transport system permease small subunit